MSHRYDQMYDRKCLLVYGSKAVIETIRDSVDKIMVVDITCRDEELVSEAVVVPIKECEGVSFNAETVCIFNGVSSNELAGMMSLLKAVVHTRLIFATTTEFNMCWKIGQLISELKLEDRQFHD